METLLHIDNQRVPAESGATLVFRASETSPRTHELIAEALTAAGFPAGVLNFITHDLSTAPEAVEAIIAHPAVLRVNFSGDQ